MILRTLKISAAFGAFILGSSLGLPSIPFAQDAGTLDQSSAERLAQKPGYSPYAGRNFPTRPFFGDTHLHTAFSMDAGAFGARLGPKEAYRFARGEEITASAGERAKLSRPLDFLVVADHSDGMGFFPLIVGGDPVIMASPQGKKWHDMIFAGQGAAAAIEIITNFGKGTIDREIMPVPGTRAYQSAWQQTIKAAEEANDPGRFTAFIGLRMDLEHGRQQSPPQRHLPRQRPPRRPSRAVYDASASWQRQSPRSLEVDGRLRGEDRRQRPGDRP
jgi:hypothetical protein